MIQPTRLPIDLAWSSKPSSQRNRLVARSSEPFAVTRDPTFCLCAATAELSRRGPPSSIEQSPAACSLFAPPVHQTKPIGHGPSSGLVQYIFSSPARLRSPCLPAYTYCRRAAKLKMLCITSICIFLYILTVGPSL